MLKFVIPTHRRPVELGRCVRSIAGQCVEGVSVVVLADGDDVETVEVLEGLVKEFPVVSWRPKEVVGDYSEAFREMFGVVGDGWVWTFGDDDLLEEGGVDAILRLLGDTDLEFVHVSERSRYSGTDGLYRGDLWTLSNTFGWLEMTGFISGNVCKAGWLRKAVESPRWDLYARSAFVHSCALLEVLGAEKCGLWDMPLVRTQNPLQTQECIDRWVKEGIPDRYLLVADALSGMYEAGILTKKAKKNFFRYQEYHLWNRHLVHWVNDYLGQGVIYPAEKWVEIKKLARFLDKPGEIEQDIETVMGMIGLHAYMTANLGEIRKGIEAMQDRHNEHAYPFGYVIPRDML